MTQIGLNVPPGFVITTEACLHYLESGSKDVPEDMMRQVREHMARVEQATGRVSATLTIHCWCRCAAGPRCRCRA